MSLAVAVSIAAMTGCGDTRQRTRPTESQPPATAGGYQVSIAGAGVTIGGILYRPEAVDSRPAIIVIHGWLPAGSNGAATVEARARRYAEAGYVALAIAMRGWPPSSGADDCGLRQPDDVVRVAEWLRMQPGVEEHRHTNLCPESER